MEEWQRELVRSNLHKLGEITNCNPPLLLSAGIFTSHELAKLSSINNPYERAIQFYDVIQQKHDGFDVLLKALKSAKQTGAAHLLSSLAQDSRPARADETGRRDSIAISADGEYDSLGVGEQNENEEVAAESPSQSVDDNREEEEKPFYSGTYVLFLRRFLRRKSTVFCFNSVFVPASSIVLYCVLAFLFIWTDEFQSVSFSPKTLLKLLGMLIYFAHPILKVWFKRKQALEITEEIQRLESESDLSDTKNNLIIAHLAVVGTSHILSVIGYSFFCSNAFDICALITYTFSTTLTWIPVDYFIIFTVSALTEILDVNLSGTKQIPLRPDEEKTNGDRNDWVQNCCKNYLDLVECTKKLSEMISPILLVCMLNHFVFIGILVNRVFYTDEGPWIRCFDALISLQTITRFLFMLYLCSKVNAKAVEVKALLDAFGYVLSAKSQEFLLVRLTTSFVGFNVKGLTNVTRKFTFIVISALASFILGVEKFEKVISTTYQKVECVNINSAS